jgi:predicted component of type VI protein secretion system
VKLMLGMVTPIKWQGTFIPVAHFPFLIGRDAGCHLRAHSQTVAGRQCALLVKHDRIFINEIGCNQATFVNEQQVHGELELHDQDRVKVGGLEFTIRCETDSPQLSRQSTPDSKAASTEDAAADLLLAMDKEEKSRPAAPASTSSPDDSAKMLPKETKSSQPELPDTAAAARDLLAKYKKPHSAAGGRGLTRWSLQRGYPQHQWWG